MLRIALIKLTLISLFKMKTKLYLAMALLGFLAVNGCKKDDDGGGTPNLSIDSDPQTEFKLDGTTVSFSTSNSDVSQYFSNSYLLATPPDTTVCVYGAGFEKNSTSGLSIDKGTYKFTVFPTDSAALVNFFKKQSYSYSPDAENGISITYYDDAGDPWSTSLGTGNQSGSTFTIEETKYQELLGDKYIRVKAKFSCKVYSSSGAVKNITDGVAVLDYWAEY
jgi:hypothetical protein